MRLDLKEIQRLLENIDVIARVLVAHDNIIILLRFQRSSRLKLSQYFQLHEL